MKRLLALFTVLGCSSLAHASIILQQDRLVFEPGENSAILGVDGDRYKTFLVQSWVSDTNDNEVGSLAVVPVVAVIQAGQAQNIRVIYQGQGLPTDRETRLRLNIQAVAAQKDNAAGENTLTPSYIQSIALFYRPAALSNHNPNDTPKKITWNLDKKAANQYTFTVKNPTPFNILLSSAFIVDRGNTTSKIYGISSNLGYIEPMGQMSFSISKKDDIALNETVNRREIWFTTKNDVGLDLAYYATITEEGVGSFSLFTPPKSPARKAEQPSTPDEMVETQEQ